MAEELSDAEVMRPAPKELSDADVMTKPPSREGGIIQTVPEFIHELATPAEREPLLKRAVSTLQPLGQTSNPKLNVIYGMISPFWQSYKKAVTQGLTPEEETSFALNAALQQLGIKSPFSKPAVAAAHPVVQEFNDKVLVPTAERLDSYGKTGDPNGVRLDPPAPGTKPDILGAVQGSPIASVPTSMAAQTGDPVIDSILNHPTIKAVIDNPVIDRSHTIPYEAGGSEPTNRATTYIDKHVPKTFTISSLSDPAKKITFDPAEPTIVHENTEEFAMELLIKNGMKPDAAYRVAHFNIAEVAEHAWYRAHDIDPAAAEAEWKKLQPGIQHEIANETPADLYTKAYPGADVTKARHEEVFERGPTPEETTQAWEILRNAPELQPKSVIPMLQEARDLGVIGMDAPENINLARLAERAKDTPAEAAFRAVPPQPQNLGAAITPKDMIGPMGHAPGSYDARGKEWVSKIETSDDARGAIERIAQSYDWYPESRAGAPSPAARAAVAEAAGIDPKDIDSKYFGEHFDNDAKVRATIQALKQTTQDFIDASERARREPTEENAAALMEAEMRQNHVLEYTLGKRAESGRSLNAWKELLREQERGRATVKLKAGEATGEVPTGVSDLVKAAGEVKSNLNAPKEGELGLGKLIDTARNLVEEQEKAPETRKKLTDVAKRIRAAAQETEAKKPVNDLLEAADEVRSNLDNPKQGKLGLQKLVDAAQDLVDAQAKTPAGSPPLPGDLASLVDNAKQTLSLLKGRGQKTGLDRLIAQAERDLTEQVKQKAGQRPKLFPELQSLVDAAKEVQVSPKPTGFDALIAEATELAKTLPQGPKEIGKPEPQGLPSMINEARRAVTATGAPGAVAKLTSLAEEAERLAMTMPRTPEEAAAKMPADLRALVSQARQTLSAVKGQRPDSVLDNLVAKAERDVTARARQNPAERNNALPPEWQALVDKADFVTKRFGGIAKGEEAAMLLARAGRTAAEQAELARQVDGLTPNQVARVLQRLRDNRDPHWTYAFVVQGLISGLVTHTFYPIINALQSVVDRVLAPELAAITERLAGHQEKSLVAPIHAGMALIRSFPDSFAGAQQAFKTGMRIPLESELRLAARGEKSPEAAGAKTPYGGGIRINWGTFKPEKFWGRVLGTTPEGLDKAAERIGIPGRFANAQHTFFKIANERASLALQAYEKASNEERPGSEAFWNRYQYHIDNPTDEMLSKATTDGYSGTFMDKLGARTQRMASLVRDTPAKWVIFFTHIPFKIAQRGIENSPVAILHMLSQTKTGMALKGELGADAAHLAWAHVAIGTAFSAYIMNKVLGGQATGDYPTDPKEQQRWRDLGIQPNSIQAGGQWWSLTRFGPIGVSARIAANWAHVIQHYENVPEDTAMHAGFALALGTANAIIGDVGFETAKGLIDVMQGREDANRFAAYHLASILQPVSMLSQAASFFDPYMREADTLIKGMQARLPFARQALLPKRDPVFGEPVPNPGYLTILRSSQVSVNPIKTEMDRLNYFPAPPDHTIGGIRLTDQQYGRYEATAGSFAKQLLTREINRPGYRSTLDAEKIDRLKGIVEFARGKARQAMLHDDPELIQKASDARKAVIQAHRTPPTMAPIPPGDTSPPLAPTLKQPSEGFEPSGMLGIRG